MQSNEVIEMFIWKNIQLEVFKTVISIRHKYISWTNAKESI